ncbi:MAG: LamG domain-containing protein [Sphingobacteriia bacterium]|jgi:hypothetical protein
MKKTFLFIVCYLFAAAYGQGSGKALNFDGSGYIGVPSFSFDNRDFAVSMWATNGGVGSGQIENLWGSGYTGGNQDVEFVILDNGTPYMQVRDASFSIVAVSTTTRVDDGAWHHLVFMRQGNVFSMYVDGNLSGSATRALGDVDATGAQARIGDLSLLTGRRLTGRLDEVRVWNRALSQDEIRHKMCQKLTGDEPGLVAYYRMDEGADNTCPGGLDVCDASGNGNHGVKQ